MSAGQSVSAERQGTIHVIAGTNGAGKSSVVGSRIRHLGGEYFNPDEATQRILRANPGAALADANSAAWHHGREMLERAIEENGDLAIETTLGGRTITGLLQHACRRGRRVVVWYVGLQGIDLHLERVRERVARGGHGIPEARIRERYDRSRKNLISLMPDLSQLRLYDNSGEADESTGRIPPPLLVLHCRQRAIVARCSMADVPEWAKPIVAAAFRLRE